MRGFLGRFLAAPEASDCRTGGPHDYEVITLGGYNAPSVDVLSCRVCGQDPDARDGSVPPTWPADYGDHTAFDYDLDERCEP